MIGPHIRIALGVPQRVTRLYVAHHHARIPHLNCPRGPHESLGSTSLTPNARVTRLSCICVLPKFTWLKFAFPHARIPTLNGHCVPHNNRFASISSTPMLGFIALVDTPNVTRLHLANAHARIPYPNCICRSTWGHSAPFSSPTCHDSTCVLPFWVPQGSLGAI